MFRNAPTQLGPDVPLAKWVASAVPSLKGPALDAAPVADALRREGADAYTALPALVRALNANRNITEVSFDGARLEGVFGEAMTRVIARLACVRLFSFARATIDAATYGHLLPALRAASAVRLSYPKTPEAAQFLRGVFALPAIDELAVIGPAPAGVAVGVIPESNLGVLRLHALTDVAAAHPAAIAHMVAAPAKLRTLDLFRTRVPALPAGLAALEMGGPREVAEVAAAMDSLKDDADFVRLSLAGVEAVGADWLARLAAATPQMPHLREIDLTGLPADRGTAAPIGAILARMPALERAVLARVRASGGWPEAVDGLRGADGLHTLVLSGSAIGAAHGRAVVEALAGLRGLRSLSLDATQIGREAVWDLAAAGLPLHEIRLSYADAASPDARLAPLLGHGVAFTIVPVGGEPHWATKGGEAWAGQIQRAARKATRAAAQEEKSKKEMAEFGGMVQTGVRKATDRAGAALSNKAGKIGKSLEAELKGATKK